MKRPNTFAKDDMDINVSTSTPTSLPKNGEKYMQLDAKLRQALIVLQHVNQFLVMSPLHVIAKSKPIFDEEKTKLVKLNLFVEKAYANHFENKGIDFRLQNDTDFQNWNNLVSEINELIDDIEGKQLPDSNKYRDNFDWKTKVFIAVFCVLFLWFGTTFG